MPVVPTNPESIAAAAGAIRRGEVVAYPAESMYGLGADPFSDDAVERVYAIKGRDFRAPILLVIGELDHLDAVTGTLSGRARHYIETFWPGPLTLVLPASQRLSKRLLGEGNRIGIRLPHADAARDICRAVGHAITSTSANVSGMPPARTAADAALDGVALVIDGGSVPDGEPTTVFDPDSGIVYREGAISANSLIAVAPD